MDKQEKITLVAACKKLGSIIRSHRAGSPILQEIASRILAKEAARNRKLFENPRDLIRHS